MRATPPKTSPTFGSRSYSPTAATQLARGGHALLDIRVASHFTLETERRPAAQTETSRRDAALTASTLDLQRVLQQISGAKFELRRSDDFSKGIVIGTAQDFAALGLRELADALRMGSDGSDGREAFYIRTEPARVIIAANTGYGLSHGIQRLLRELGYHHLAMGGDWEIVPRRTNLELSLHISDRPAFYIRNLAPLGADAYFATPTIVPDRAAWQRRVMLDGNSLRLNPSHMWQSLARWKFGGRLGAEIFDEHPEYILGYGKSRARTGQPFSAEARARHLDVAYKFDVSNPAVRALFLERARAIIASSDPSEEEVPVPVGPSDGADWYLQDLSDPNWYRELGYEAPNWTGSISDHVFGLANFLADHLTKEFPNRRPLFCLLAYDAYHEPPGFRLHPNVRVSVVQGSCAGAGCGLRALLRWKDRIGSAPLQATDYVSVWVWTQGEPPASGHVAPEALKQHFWNELYQNGVRALNAEAQADIGANALGYYLFAAASWNPLADFGALRREFLQLAFGAAASVMDDYFSSVDPDSSEPLSQLRWARSVALLDRASSVAREHHDAGAERRIDVLRYYWYYLYLKRELDAHPDDPTLRAHFLEHFFRQNESLSVSFDAYARELERRGFEWKRGLTPLPWRGSLAASGCKLDPNTKAVQPCSRPEWLESRRRYTREEFEPLWRDVRNYFKPIEVQAPQARGPYVPVHEAADVHRGSCFERGASFSARATVEAWTYSYTGEPVRLKLYDFTNGAPSVGYEVSVYAGDGSLVRRVPWRDQSAEQAITIEEPVPRAGSYRVVVQHSVSAFRVKPSPGYPLAFELAPDDGARTRRLVSPGMVFYVPGGSERVLLDVRAAKSTISLLAPNAQRESPQIVSGDPVHGGILRQAVGAERFGLWQCVFPNGTPVDSLRALGTPDLFASPDGYLLLPEALARRDGMTEAKAPYARDRFELSDMTTNRPAAALLGQFEEVFDAPEPPRALGAAQGIAADSPWLDSKSATAIYRNVTHPSVYLVRSASSRRVKNQYVDEALGPGWFVLFDSKGDATSAAYLSRARSPHDVIPYDGLRSWIPTAGGNGGVALKLTHLPCGG